MGGGWDFHLGRKAWANGKEKGNNRGNNIMFYNFNFPQTCKMSSYVREIKFVFCFLVKGMSLMVLA